MVTSFLVDISFTVPVLRCAFDIPEEHGLLKNKSIEPQLLCAVISSLRFFMGVQSTTSHGRNNNIPFACKK